MSTLDYRYNQLEAKINKLELEIKEFREFAEAVRVSQTWGGEGQSVSALLVYYGMIDRYDGKPTKRLKGE
jgi:hypothetical protein